MLRPQETAYVRERAYIPEHVVPYVTSISKAEPFLARDFLCYVRDGTLIFIGYPLQGEFTEEVFAQAISDARDRWRPKTVSMIAPITSKHRDGCSLVSSDRYYELPLPTGSLPPTLAYMIRRASKELTVKRDDSLGESHLRLIHEFLLTRQIDDATRSILQCLPNYVASSETAVVFSANCRDGSLAAFSIGEYWGGLTAMYMFNFTSRKNRVPGASDLLLSALLREAQERGNIRANLGLGINKGIAFFKKKWGAGEMCGYHHYLCDERGAKGFSALFRRLSSFSFWGTATI